MSLEGQKRGDVLDERLEKLWNKAQVEILENLRAQNVPVEKEGELEKRSDRILDRMWFAAERAYHQPKPELSLEEEARQEHIRERLKDVEDVFLKSGHLSDVTAKRLAALLIEMQEIGADTSGWGA